MNDADADADAAVDDDVPCAVPVQIRGILPANTGCAIFVGNDEKVFVIQVEHNLGAVIDACAERFEVTREEIEGSFDFVLEFDVKSLDMEYLSQRWDALSKAFSIPRGILFSFE